MKTLRQLGARAWRIVGVLAILAGMLGVGLVASFKPVSGPLGAAAEWLWPIGWLAISIALLLLALITCLALNDRLLDARAAQATALGERDTARRSQSSLEARLDPHLRSLDRPAAQDFHLQLETLGAEPFWCDFATPWPRDLEVRAGELLKATKAVGHFNSSDVEHARQALTVKLDALVNGLKRHGMQDPAAEGMRVFKAISGETGRAGREEQLKALNTCAREVDAQIQGLRALTSPA
jgi:hypothetical protein